MYTEAQLDQYFQHISYPKETHATDPLELLTALQRHHLARVPFESISLHYSKTRLLSLDLQDLFDKIVINSRGGYCMEVNAFFGAVLRSLGFTLITAGARVKGEEFGGWSHMVNLVTIDSQRYVVDVGFGSKEPAKPIPLQDEHEFSLIGSARGKLEYKNITHQHSDPTQRVWVYSHKADGNSEWMEMYAFVEIEFFPADFEVMNISTMTGLTSPFVKSVLAMRTVLSEDGSKTVGVLTLLNDYVKQKIGDETQELEKMVSEDDRVKALEKYFFITLSPGQQKAIKGLASELKG